MITERTLGIATIGQAPRDDIAALFYEQVPASTHVLLRGCLDNLTDEKYFSSVKYEQAYYAAPRNARLSVAWSF